MIAGAKKYATDHPDQVELTTNACKTNDDTPCQIAADPGRRDQGRPGDRHLPDGRGRARRSEGRSRQGVSIVFVDNTMPGVIPDAVSATNNVKGGQAAGAYIKTQLKSGDTIGLLEAVRACRTSTSASTASRRRSQGPASRWSSGGQQTLCDPKTGAAVTQDLLTKYPNLTAIYSACDSPAMGAVDRRASRRHPLKIFGYDGDPEMAKLILAGKTTATMAQSPFKMTNLGILAAVNSILGKPLRKDRHRRHAGHEGQRRPVQGRLAVDHRWTDRVGTSRHAECRPGPRQR